MGKKFQSEVENFYVSFSDLLALLLIFFVYLFSMSTIDPVKFTESSDSISEQFSKDKNKASSGAFGKADPTRGEESKDGRTAEGILVGKLSSYIQKENLEGQAAVEVSPKAVKVILSSPVLFQSGDANLSLAGMGLLQKLGPVFKEVANPVVIEGHTDNVPISNALFSSNWELSFQRTLSVMRFFVSRFGFTPDQLSGTGYGEYRPLVPNSSELNRAKNRRIEISILRDYSTQSVSVSQLKSENSAQK